MPLTQQRFLKDQYRKLREPEVAMIRFVFRHFLPLVLLLLSPVTAFQNYHVTLLLCLLSGCIVAICLGYGSTDKAIMLKHKCIVL